MGLKLTIYVTQNEHVNHYTTDAVILWIDGNPLISTLSSFNSKYENCTSPALTELTYNHLLKC